MKLFIFLGITIFSSIGWWLGSMEGMMTAILFSTVGGVVGVVAGIKLYNILGG